MADNCVHWEPTRRPHLWSSFPLVELLVCQSCEGFWQCSGLGWLGLWGVVHCWWCKACFCSQEPSSMALLRSSRCSSSARFYSILASIFPINCLWLQDLVLFGDSQQAAILDCLLGSFYGYEGHHICWTMLCFRCCFIPSLFLSFDYFCYFYC